MGRSYQKNDVIETVEGRQFRIISQLAEGGFSTIYRAEEIFGEECHAVLLKAFCMDDEESTALIRHELSMNRQVLERGFSGVLTIDYPVHGQFDGTIYGVMPADRYGRTLREYVDSAEYSSRSLRDRLELCRRLYCLVKNFHEKCHMIHGDISPDNIFILNTEDEKDLIGPLVLLDLGLARSMNSEATVPIGGTEGYTSPELLYGQRSHTLARDDWYSAAACAWFCVTEQPPTEYEVMPEHVEAAYNRLALYTVWNGFGNDPVDILPLQEHRAKQQTVLSMLKELFLQPKDEPSKLIGQITAILDILDKTGINRERLIASLREEYLTLRQERFANVDIISRILPDIGFQSSQNTAIVYRTKYSRPEPLHQVVRTRDEPLFVIGDGGMGKTTSLLQIMDDNYRLDNSETIYPIIFLELYTLSQEMDDWYSPGVGGTFLEQFTASYFTQCSRRYMPKGHPYVSLLREEFFRAPVQGERQYTVLLDGLNEVGFSSEHSRKAFFDALNHYINHAHNLRIILTGRSDTYELSAQHIQRFYTRGLDDLTIESMLLSAVEQGRLSLQEYHRITDGRHNFFSNEYRLWQCLQIPFFLMMYCVIEQKGPASRQGEILRNFFNDKRDTLNGSQIYGEKGKGAQRHSGKKYSEACGLRMDLSIRVILDFIVPEIALQMVVGNTHFMSLEQISKVIQNCLDPAKLHTRFQNWHRWYYGYEIDVYSVFDEIGQIDGGERIPQYICELLGVMRVSSDRTLSFTHQYFRDYFAACALVGRILTVLEAKAENPSLTALDEQFSSIIYPFNRKLFSSHVCSLVGEVLGESHNLPVYDEAEGVWKLPEISTSEQTVLSRFLECYRIAPEHGLYRTAAIGFENLIDIFKGSRVQNDGRVDFSGMALHNLDLKNISLSGIFLSRYSREHDAVLAADLTGSSHVEEALLQNGRVQPKRCIAAHPAKKMILLWDEWDRTITEYDLEHDEMTLVCSGIEQFHSAYYRQSNDSILVVSYQMIPDEEVERPARRLGIIQELVDLSQIEEGEDDFLDMGGQEIQIHVYHRKKRPFLRTVSRGELIIGSNWSENDQELSLLLQRSDGSIRLTVVSIQPISGENGETLAESLAILEKEFSERIPFTDIESSTEISDKFMFTRTEEGWYVLASPNWPGNVCFCDFMSHRNTSLLYIDGLEQGCLLQAIYSDGIERSYYLKNGNLVESQGSIYPAGVKPFKYSLSTDQGRIEALPLKGDLLCLSQNALLRIDPEAKRVIWTADPPVKSYFWCGGALIANSIDGIYEINVTDGNSTCIQHQLQTSFQFMMGRTGKSAEVVLLDETGIIKWINVHTGCCSRQTSIQLQGSIAGLQIYAEQNSHEILGLRDRRVYIWDDCTGRLKHSEMIPELPDKSILWSEIFQANIMVYFKAKDYDRFPLKVSYGCLLWDIKEQNWRTVSFSGKDNSCPFRLHFSEKMNSSYIEKAPFYLRRLEQVQVEMRPGHVVWNAYKKFWESLKNGLMDGIQVEPQPAVEERGSLYKSDNMIEWVPDLWEELRVHGQAVNSGWMAPSRNTPRMLGWTGDEIVSAAVNRGSGTCDIIVVRNQHKSRYRLTQLFGCQIKQAQVTDKVVIFHVRDQDEETERLVFWDMETSQVYFHRAVEGVAVAGCVGANEENAHDLKLHGILGMQGIGAGERSSLGTSIDLSIQNKLEVKTSVERRKTRNFGVLLFLTALAILNGWFILLIESGRMVDPYYIQKLCGIYIPFLILLFVSKTVLPPLVRVSWRGIYGGTYLILILPLAMFSRLFPMNSAAYFLARNFPFLSIPFIIVHMLHSRNAAVVVSVPLLLSGTIMAFINYFSDNPDDMYYAELCFLIVILTMVLAWKQIRDRSHFLKVLGLSAFLLLLMNLAVVFLGHGTYPLDILSGSVWSESQAQLKEYCLDVFKAAELIGPADVPMPDFFISDTRDYYTMMRVEYMGAYFLNYVIREYGLLPAYGCILLILGLVISMLIGVRGQESPLDRYICMSSTVFIIVEAVLAFLSSTGMLSIPAICTPFLNYAGTLYKGDQLALCIYIAFYHAHRQVE